MDFNKVIFAVHRIILPCLVYILEFIKGKDAIEKSGEFGHFLQYMVVLCKTVDLAWDWG